MQIRLGVPGGLPRRSHPGRCADRSSPDAASLFGAARRLVEGSPERYPLTTSVRVVLITEGPLPIHEGYDALDPVVEVLVDAGVLADERLVDRERHLVREVRGGGFEVELHAAEDPFDQSGE